MGGGTHGAREPGSWAVGQHSCRRLLLQLTGLRPSALPPPPQPRTAHPCRYRESTRGFGWYDWLGWFLPCFVWLRECNIRGWLLVSRRAGGWVVDWLGGWVCGWFAVSAAARSGGPAWVHCKPCWWVRQLLRFQACQACHRAAGWAFHPPPPPPHLAFPLLFCPAERCGGGAECGRHGHPSGHVLCQAGRPAPGCVTSQTPAAA
jgi:hypothetical protein